MSPLRLILAPDSFKGSMTAATVAAVMRRAVLAQMPDAQIMTLPAADGGEGSVDAFLRVCGGKRVTAEVAGPHGKAVFAAYGRLSDGRTAVVEMSAASGLPQMGASPDPEAAGTFGVGELILHALQAGATRILLALGGSAGCDAGLGMASALGVRFLDAGGRAFVPVGGTLGRVADADESGLSPLLRASEIVALHDVRIPLYGENGAAFLFAPQKGASPAAVLRLDAGLRHIAALFGGGPAVLPGAGAAGGMGYGAARFLGARLTGGADMLLDLADFDRMLDRADAVLTGEGRADGTSAEGKLLSAVAARAAKKGVPVIAVCGCLGEGAASLCTRGVTAIVPVSRIAPDMETARCRAESDLYDTVDMLMRLWARLPAAQYPPATRA